MGKAQSAIEYTINYGWMLLVAGVASGAIFSAVDNQGIESTTGFSNEKIAVVDFGQEENGKLAMSLQSQAHETVKIKSVTVNGTQAIEGSGGPEISASQEKQITLSEVKQTEETRSLEVEIIYDRGALKNISIQGKLIGNLDVANHEDAIYTADGTYKSKVEATGGITKTETINGQKYKIHAFKSTGTSTFTVQKSGKVDVLVVAGGGGGGGRHGSGGGAGGVIYESSYPAEGEYSVKVGQGGTGGSGSGSSGTKGENSTFGELTAIGGGAGHGADDASGNQDGGSGGGENSYEANTVGQAEQPSSKDGGYGSNGGGISYGSDSPYNHAGGGGAKQRGSYGTTTSPGSGGDGKDYTDVFGTKYGDNGIFAGGGGGGSHDPRPDQFNNEGGLGGGGHGGEEPYSTSTDSGSLGDDGEDGLDNTGGGGGGGSTDSSSGGGGGDGGSGIVLIRYPVR